MKTFCFSGQSAFLTLCTFRAELPRVLRPAVALAHAVAHAPVLAHALSAATPLQSAGLQGVAEVEGFSVDDKVPEAAAEAREGGHKAGIVIPKLPRKSPHDQRSSEIQRAGKEDRSRHNFAWKLRRLCSCTHWKESPAKMVVVSTV